MWQVFFNAQRAERLNNYETSRNIVFFVKYFFKTQGIREEDLWLDKLFTTSKKRRPVVARKRRAKRRNAVVVVVIILRPNKLAITKRAARVN